MALSGLKTQVPSEASCYQFAEKLLTARGGISIDGNIRRVKNLGAGGKMQRFATHQMRFLHC